MPDPSWKVLKARRSRCTSSAVRIRTSGIVWEILLIQQEPVRTHSEEPSESYCQLHRGLLAAGFECADMTVRRESQGVGQFGLSHLPRQTKGSELAPESRCDSLLRQGLTCPGWSGGPSRRQLLYVPKCLHWR